MPYYVYLLTTSNNKVMYVGVTNNLTRRVYEHKNKMVPGFTNKYNVHKLVYFEETEDVLVAIQREKEIKKWRREKKECLGGVEKPVMEGSEPGMVRKISPSGRNDKMV